MLWLPVTIFAYAANAIVAVADKYVLRRPVKNWAVFAFYVGVLGLVFLAAAPFALTLPSLSVLVATLTSGALFTLNLLALFYALQQSYTSRVIPVYGAILPIATLAFAAAFLGEAFSERELLAMLLLVTSSIVLAFSRQQEEAGASTTFLWAAVAAILFSASLVLARYAFFHHPFLSGFIWIRLGGGMTALFFFLYPGFLASLRESRKDAPPKTDFLIIGVRVLAGAGFIALHFAVSIAPVSIVNALKGIEYAFIFLLTFFLSRTRPDIVYERITPHLAAAKLLAIGGIGAGLALLIH